MVKHKANYPNSNKSDIPFVDWLEQSRKINLFTILRENSYYCLSYLES